MTVDLPHSIEQYELAVLLRAYETDNFARMLPTFVISLPDSVARRDAISRRLGNLGISFEWVDAVDGRNGLSTEFEPMIDRRNSLKEDGSPLHDAELACSLSHIEALRTVVERNLAYALILEDDAIPRPDLPDYLSRRLFTNADLTTLGYSESWVSGWKGTHLHGSYRSFLCAPARRWRKTYQRGAFGYIVSFAGARHIIENAVPVDAVADWPRCVEYIRQRRRMRLVYPCLVDHPREKGADSIIGRFGRRKRPKRRFLGVYVPPMPVVAKSIILAIGGRITGLRKVTR